VVPRADIGSHFAKYTRRVLPCLSFTCIGKLLKCWLAYLFFQLDSDLLGLSCRKFSSVCLVLNVS
jgi:hypothetical protein